MTVSSSTSRIEYLGDGMTVTFAVPFYFMADADLKVYIRDAAGVETLKSLTTDYTVAGAGVMSGGSITTVFTPTATDTLIVFRDPDLLQNTDYVNNDPFPAESHERALDKLTMQVQRDRDIVARAMRLSDAAAVTVDTQLPAPEANKVLAWNSAADGLTNVVQAPSTTNLTNWTDSKQTGYAILTSGYTGSVLGNKEEGITVAQAPDNTYHAGNARGTGATDWQKKRTNANQVAAGTYSVIAGGSGNQVAVTGDYSIIGGGLNNIVADDYVTVSGGAGNACNALGATIGGGITNSASASGAVVSGGNGNIASALGAMIPGGYLTTASHYCEFAHGSGNLYQIGELIFSCETSAATKEELFLDGDGGSYRFTLADGNAYSVQIHISGKQATGAMGSALYEAKIARVGATTKLRGTMLPRAILSWEGDAGLGIPIIDIEANDTVDALTISVTPANNTATSWAAALHYIKHA